MFTFSRMFHDVTPRTFSVELRCFSVSMMPQGRQELEKGGKIILPPSALDTLTTLHIQYPMLFKLSNQRDQRVTHCGVLEFVAEEGRVYLPYWMMTNLLLDQGDLILVENLSLSVATYAKFQAQSTDFLDITNQKAVLENALRNFACLTSGDMIAIDYNDKIYELKVLETKPKEAVSIIECDMNVEFATPVGYKEPERENKMKEEEEDEMEIDISQYIDKNKFQVFGGQGSRLDGKLKSQTHNIPKQNITNNIRGIPNYNYKKGRITFIRTSRNQNDAQDKTSEPSFTAFSGQGKSIRSKAKDKHDK